jgi:hypothetical protein
VDVDQTDPKLIELLRLRRAPDVSAEDAEEAMRAAANIARVVLMHYRRAGSPNGSSRAGLMLWLVEQLMR